MSSTAANNRKRTLALRSPSTHQQRDGACRGACSGACSGASAERSFQQTACSEQHAERTLGVGGGCCSSVSSSTPMYASALRPKYIIHRASTDDFLLHAARALALDTSLQLALQVWRRVHGLVRVVTSVRQPPAAALMGSDDSRRLVECERTQRTFAAACLWLSAKLEEQRGSVPSAVVFAAVAGTTAHGVCGVELRVLQWCDWSPRSRCSTLGSWGV
ncbi:hypothetical protein TSOC_001228 [Tetrabaena socialis]|uniref:Uncharacterized protein n=1 Tax=Tetrabaena socialis TaxID=47790 RepID=A0A2J8AHD0_9CHLO|nr:hypothetical protein TSOC_001228 [Tetrabaena socialis]|eukprot:PNH11906.1 hypothetical protein TSOC_001228 [Tetrabaena socialis]